MQSLRVSLKVTYKLKSENRKPEVKLTFNARCQIVFGRTAETHSPEYSD